MNVLLIALYFLLYRFCSSLLTTATAQAVVFVILFAIFDYLMRMQIKYQLGVNFLKYVIKYSLYTDVIMITIPA